MSLKAVHICFIVLSILLSLAFGFWGIREYSTSGDRVNLWLGVGSLVAAGPLIYYLFRFLQKMKNLKPFFLALIFLSLSSNPLWACSVCFGDPNSRLSKGILPAVLFLMGVVGTVLVGIASVSFTWARRARKMPPSSPH